MRESPFAQLCRIASDCAAIRDLSRIRIQGSFVNTRSTELAACADIVVKHVPATAVPVLREAYDFIQSRRYESMGWDSLTIHEIHLAVWYMACLIYVVSALADAEAKDIGRVCVLPSVASFSTFPLLRDVLPNTDRFLRIDQAKNALAAICNKHKSLAPLRECLWGGLLQDV